MASKSISLKMSPLILFVILFNLIVNIDSVNGLDMFGDPSSSSSALHEKNQEKNTEKIEISSSYGDICKDYIHYYCDCDYLIPGQARHVQCSIFNITGLESNSDEWNHFWTQPNIESLTMDCRDRSSDGLSYVPSVALAYIFNTIKFISLIYFKIDTIKSYTFTNIPLLETIILDENRIETMEEYSFNNLPNVTKISLIRNGIKSIKKGTFVHLPKLKELDVSSCNIDTIDEESFHNISSLTILSLKNNNISSLSPEIFQNLNNLEDLDLAYNSITFLVDNLFSDCSSLKYLDLQSNSIIQLERNTFQGLVSLVTLNLSRNKLKYIGDVSLFSSPSLSYVTIGENHLEKLDPRFIDSIHNKDQLHFLIDFKGNKWKCDCDLSWMEQVSKIATNTELLSQLNHSECSETSSSYNSETSQEEERKEKEEKVEEKGEGRKNWINILKEYLPSNREECWRKMNPNQGRKYFSSLSPSLSSSSSSSSSSLTSLSINFHMIINLQFFFFFISFFSIEQKLIN